jgi:hypothetical protein
VGLLYADESQISFSSFFPIQDGNLFCATSHVPVQIHPHEDTVSGVCHNDVMRTIKNAL